jgi:hypothetical protein
VTVEAEIGVLEVRVVGYASRGLQDRVVVHLGSRLSLVQVLDLDTVGRVGRAQQLGSHDLIHLPELSKLVSYALRFA